MTVRIILRDIKKQRWD